MIRLLITSLLLTSCTALAGGLVVDEGRKIEIYEVVRAPSILDYANRVFELAAESSDPIYVVINSPGGSVFAGLQFISALDQVRSQGVEVRCVVPGMAASMAFQILIHCDKRYALRYSLLLWHPVRVAGFMVITPDTALALYTDMAAIEALMVPELITALGMPESEFYYHYRQETMWTAASLALAAPKFLEIVDNVQGISLPWDPSRMRGESEGGDDGVFNPLFTRDIPYILPELQSPTPSPSPTPAPSPTTDCRSCHTVPNSPPGSAIRNHYGVDSGYGTGGGK